jgi:hypothetical protein
MDDLKNQASKIKQEQEKQIDETAKISLEQKSANEIINIHEKEKRKLEEEELSGFDLPENI